VRDGLVLRMCGWGRFVVVSVVGGGGGGGGGYACFSY